MKSLINGEVVESQDIPIQALEEAESSLIPDRVSMRQARLYLLATGDLNTINSTVASMGEAEQLTWEYSQEVQRSNPVTQAVAAILGWTETQVDTFFIEASKL